MTLMKRWVFGCLSRLVDHTPSLCPLSSNCALGESRFEALERAAYRDETSRASDKMSHTIRKDTRFFFFLNAASLYRLRDMDGAVVLERTSMEKEGSRPRFPVEWVSWFKELQRYRKLW